MGDQMLYHMHIKGFKLETRNRNSQVIAIISPFSRTRKMGAFERK